MKGVREMAVLDAVGEARDDDSIGEKDMECISWISGHEVNTGLEGELQGEKALPHIIGYSTMNFNPIRVSITALGIDTPKLGLLDKKNIKGGGLKESMLYYTMPLDIHQPDAKSVLRH
jgi:hypothetical protein